MFTFFKVTKDGRDLDLGAQQVHIALLSKPGEVPVYKVPDLGDKIGDMALDAVTLILTICWGGILLAIFWGWFIIPIFHTSPLNLPQAIGLTVVVRFLIGRLMGPGRNDGASWKSSLSWFLMSLVVLLLAWIVKQFM
jgi:hypothetical protein